VAWSPHTRALGELSLKILLGSSLYEPNAIGGAEKVVRALAIDFISRGHQVVVVTTQPRGTALQKYVDGASVYYVPVRNLYRRFNGDEAGPIRKALWRVVDSYNFLMTPQLSQIITREKPDIVNTHNISGLSVSLWSAVNRQRIPIVHTLHDQYLLCHRSTMFKNERNCAGICADCRLLAAPRKHASRHVDVVIGVSRFILERHKQFGYFKFADSSVIHNVGLNKTHQFSIRDATDYAIRVGFLGQIISTKGLHVLVDAFQRIGAVNGELLIAGKGDTIYASELRQKTRRNASIRWLGFMNPEQFLREIDVLVVPSIWQDTAPLVILEAFNCGIPVIASNRGGIPELMGPGTGWLFDPDEPQSLDRALRDCMQSPDKLSAMRQACLTHAHQMSSLPWSESYIAAYRAAIARHGREKLLTNDSP
jgi:glycosyltransferase involved in cell wall biosynthesis